MPHKPGLWTYAYEGSSSHNVYDMPNDDLVAQCGCDYGHDESFANGLLIAQAPAMYELLKQLEFTSGVADPVAFCQFCGTDEGKEHSEDCKLAAVLKAVEGEA